MRSVREFVRVTWLGALALGLMGVMSVGSSASAGVLVSGGGGIPAFTGSQLFDDSLGDFTVNANVDFAVFAPGAFDTAFPGQDPTEGAEYVYAYQIENLGDDVITMTVGLDGNESLGSVGFIGDVGLVNPSASQFIGTAPTSVAWDFDPGQLTNGLSSAILFFTSADAPELDSATVVATFADAHNLPSPLPEPATLSFMALGAGIVFWGKRRRA